MKRVIRGVTKAPPPDDGTRPRRLVCGTCGHWCANRVEPPKGGQCLGNMSPRYLDTTRADHACGAWSEHGRFALARVRAKGQAGDIEELRERVLLADVRSEPGP